jgi:hypothetical protein
MSVCVRVCVLVWAHTYPHAHVSAPQRASPFRRRGLCGSARRRSLGRPRSTRTSAHGTLHVSPTCPRCAPLSAGGMPRGGRARSDFDAARPVVRGGGADARVCVRTLVQALACAGVHGCMYSCGLERWNICMRIFSRSGMQRCMLVYHQCAHIRLAVACYRHGHALLMLHTEAPSKSWPALYIAACSYSQRFVRNTDHRWNMQD